jgi:cytochrome c oxidase subunit 2
MREKKRSARRVVAAKSSIATAAGACVAALAACSDNGQSALHPRGPGAERIADLWWIMLAAAGVIFLLVMVTLARGLTHRGHRAEPHSRDHTTVPTRWVVAGGVVLPTVVLTPLLVLTLHALAGLQPPGAGAAPEIVVTGLQWWWDVQYSSDKPGGALRSANEIHIPVGRPVRIQLRSSDVIHSFWAPALQGKLDLVPGQVNTTWLQADSAGVYRGACAEFCGLQHTRMQFRVVALPPSEFDAWREAQQKPAAPPTDSIAQAGHGVFMSSGCSFCHAIRGTEARATAGPDLTHVASRQTLAAGTLPNTRGHLAGWIGNPQAIKPGNLMPRIPLSPEELRSLLAYLATLR